MLLFCANFGHALFTSKTARFRVKKKITKTVYKITLTQSNAIYSLNFFCTRDLTFTDSMLMPNKPSYGLISESSVK